MASGALPRGLRRKLIFQPSSFVGTGPLTQVWIKCLSPRTMSFTWLRYLNHDSRIGYHPILLRISVHTSPKRSCAITHSGKSLFIQPITLSISACISSTRDRFQQIDSLWKTRLRKRRNVLSGADTFLRWRSYRGIYGKARRRACHSVLSYSVFNNDTQKPRVSSATILDGVICSCLAVMCCPASVIYRFKLRNPGVVGKIAYQSSRPVIVSNSRHRALRNVTSNTDKPT